MSSSVSHSPDRESQSFRDGGECRTEPHAEDDAESRDFPVIESGPFPSPHVITFPTAETERHSTNPTFDSPPGELSIDFAQQNVLSCRPSIITGTCNTYGSECDDSFGPCVPPMSGAMLRERPPTNMGSDCSFGQSDVFDGDASYVSVSNGDSCVSSTCTPLPPYPTSYG